MGDHPHFEELIIQLATCNKFTSAGLPNSFQSALYLLCTCGDYKSAVARGIEAGGCNCSRVSFIGACLAANGGLRVIPTEWIEKTQKAKEASQLLLKLFK